MTRYRRRDGVSETRVDADLFLVPPDSDEIYHLNAVGAGLWRLLAEPTAEEDAVDALAAAFPERGAAQIAADVRRFLADLKARGLLRAL